MEMLEHSQVISLSIGAGVGFLVVIIWLIVRRQRSSIKRCGTLRYADLIEFAQNCKLQFPKAWKSRVISEKLQNGRYRITQVILDEDLRAIRSASNVVLARIVICKRIDDKVRVLLESHDGGFDFQI